MPGESVTTSIDDLVKYVREHGETEIMILALELEKDVETVTDWAKVLEKAGVVRITYKVGKMFVSPVKK